MSTSQSSQSGHRKACLEKHKADELDDKQVNLHEHEVQNESKTKSDQAIDMNKAPDNHCYYIKSRKDLKDTNFIYIPEICRQLYISPSVYGRPSTFYKYQENDATKIFCNFPANACGLQVIFQCREFLQFMKDIEEIEVSPEDVTVSSEFAKIITGYKNEDEYHKSVVIPFCEMCLGPKFSMGRAMVNNFETDATIQYINTEAQEGGPDREIPVCNIEARNRMNADGPAPDLKNFGYYVKFVECFCNRKNIQPMFLLTFTGPMLSIYGAVCNQEKIFIGRLCPDLFVSQEFRFVQECVFFARVFKALREGMIALGRRYFSEQDPLPPYSHDSLFADISEFGIYEQVGGGMLFVSPDRTTCVKISESYCSESQRLLSSFGLAPEIIREKTFNVPHRNITFTEMKFLSGYRTMHRLEALIKNSTISKREGILEKLEKSLKILHSRGFVHGDFRSPNIMIHKETLDVKIIDFDYCGEEGVAVYPMLLNEEIEWHHGVKSGGLVAKEHDLFFLNELAEEFDLD